MDRVDAVLTAATEAYDAKAYSLAYGKYLEAIQSISALLKGEFAPSRCTSSSLDDTKSLIQVASLCLEKCQELVDLIKPSSSSRQLDNDAIGDVSEVGGRNVTQRSSSSPGPNSSASSPGPNSLPLSPIAFKELNGVDLPLIPVSPLTMALEQTDANLKVAQTKFETLQAQASSLDRSSQGYLSVLRKALEDCQILSDRRNRIAGQITDMNTSRVTTLDPKIIAQQLTIMDLAIFRKLDSSRELVDCAWMKPDKRSKCPNVCASIDFFNYVTHWIQSEIIGPLEVADRVSTYQFFVRVAQYLSEHCSFNMLKAVVLSLRSSAVLKLKSTLNLIPRKVSNQLDNFEAMMSDNRNYSYLRTILARKPKPAIPFLGLFLHVTIPHEALKRIRHLII